MKYLLFILIMLLLFGCTTNNQFKNELVPDYRNGKPNALVCPNDKPCFQCDHKTAKKWENYIIKTDGLIVYLPLDKEP